MNPEDVILILQGPHRGKHAYFKAEVDTIMGSRYACELIAGGNVLLSFDQFIPTKYE